ncbi:MAG: hypothetical protein ACTSRA_00485 [Promethearchaeota archaeon]|nr:MAG: hypothetical protein [Helarchaeota virus Nidhogg Meg22_1012]URC17433.1 MAG: hypothetical protein [Helarchaeota virus Nidhogg Meg22_1214]
MLKISLNETYKNIITASSKSTDVFSVNIRVLSVINPEIKKAVYEYLCDDCPLACDDCDYININLYEGLEDIIYTVYTPRALLQHVDLKYIFKRFSKKQLKKAYLRKTGAIR